MWHPVCYDARCSRSRSGREAGASGEPFSPLRPGYPEGAAVVTHIMKDDRKVSKELEPVGIVISQGWHEEKPTVFSAYVWGPAPEEGAGSGKPVAA